MTNDVKNDVVEPQIEVEPQTTANVDEQQEQKEFSKEYVSSLRKEAAQYRTELKKFQQEKEAETKKILEEQGNYKQLYESHLNELNSLKVTFTELEAKAKAFDEMQLSEKKKLLAQLPKDIAKDFEDLDTSKLAKIVEKFNVKDSLLANENNKVNPKSKLSLEEAILIQLQG